MQSTPPTESRRSKAAVVFTAAYLLAVAAALALLLLPAGKSDSLSGVYLVLITSPWSSPLMWLNRALHVDSMLFNTLFLVAGGAVNAFIIYRVVAFIARKFHPWPAG